MIVYLLKGYRALGHMEEVGDFATSASGSATRSYRVADRAQFDQRLSTILSLFPVHSIDRSNKNPSGTRQGLAISDHIKDVGGIRTQFHLVIDIGADDP